MSSQASSLSLSPMFVQSPNLPSPSSNFATPGGSFLCSQCRSITGSDGVDGSSSDRKGGEGVVSVHSSPVQMIDLLEDKNVVTTKIADSKTLSLSLSSSTTTTITREEVAISIVEGAGDTISSSRNVGQGIEALTGAEAGAGADDGIRGDVVDQAVDAVDAVDSEIADKSGMGLGRRKMRGTEGGRNREVDKKRSEGIGGGGKGVEEEEDLGELQLESVLDLYTTWSGYGEVMLCSALLCFALLYCYVLYYVRCSCNGTECFNALYLNVMHCSIVFPLL